MKLGEQLYKQQNSENHTPSNENPGVVDAEFSEVNKDSAA